MWKLLREGRVQVAIGARSALFAPVERLGLVVVDEEHDGSFKQEEGVRYHARDMALLRALRARAVCVLGSATPSLESEALARAGKLARLALPDRAHAAASLPRVELVDLRRTGHAPSAHPLVSMPLQRAIEGALARSEQVILFLNRRGFAPSVVCDGCGTLASCPHCSVSLTLHRSGGGRLRCHYCDYDVPMWAACASCGCPQLELVGLGTERLEEQLAVLFHPARVARLDRDVAAGTKSDAVLARMRRRQIDILVGTQMVTKGHDLPDVTVVGVVQADVALSLPDFRAAERTFQLLVQVAGRAGRAGRPGLVIVQTRLPEHAALRFAVAHDVTGFVEHELGNRRDAGYPPFARLVLVRLDAADERRARAEAERLAAVARREAAHRARSVQVLGPSPAPLERLRGRFRFRVVLRATQRSALRVVARAVDAARAGADRLVRVAIDVDPVQMM
jgi:primosomal protein N' (replication factor Y)